MQYSAPHQCVLIHMKAQAAGERERAEGDGYGVVERRGGAMLRVVGHLLHASRVDYLAREAAEAFPYVGKCHGSPWLTLALYPFLRGLILP